MVPGAQAFLKEDWARSRLRLWPLPFLYHWPKAKPQQLGSQWPPCVRGGHCFPTTFQWQFVQGKERDADSSLQSLPPLLHHL